MHVDIFELGSKLHFATLDGALNFEQIGFRCLELRPLSEALVGKAFERAQSSREYRARTTDDRN